MSNDKHGHKKASGATRFYRIHHNIVQRCTRPKCPMYKYYGGRGITVHEPWLDFKTFLYSLPKLPKNSDIENYSLDRIDNDKGYEPGNIKWSTRIEQANNKRNNKMLTYKGKTQSLAMWSRELGMNYMTLKSRINQSGYSIEKAFETPIKTVTPK